MPRTKKTTPITVRTSAAAVARLLTIRRQNRGWTQGQWATRLKVKPNMVCQIERTGENGHYSTGWSPRLLIAAADVLGLSDCTPYLLLLQRRDDGANVTRHTESLLSPFDKWVMTRLMIAANARLDPSKQKTPADARWAAMVRQTAAWRQRHEAQKGRRFASVIADLKAKGMSGAEIYRARDQIMERVEIETNREANRTLES